VINSSYHLVCRARVLKRYAYLLRFRKTHQSRANRRHLCHLLQLRTTDLPANFLLKPYASIVLDLHLYILRCGHDCIPRLDRVLIVQYGPLVSHMLRRLAVQGPCFILFQLPLIMKEMLSFLISLPLNCSDSANARDSPSFLLKVSGWVCASLSRD